MMRRVIAVAGMLVAMAGISSAQASAPADGMGHGGRMGGGHDMGGMQRMEAQMFRGITLTPEQKAKIDAIHAQQRTDMQAIDRKASDARAKMTEGRNRSMAAIRAVLTPEQQKVFDTNHEEMQKHMQKRQRPPAN